MTKRDLPNQTERKFLSYVGMETDLIFNHAIELPGGFASFPLLEKKDTRALLMDYAVRQIEMAKDFGKFHQRCLGPMQEPVQTIHVIQRQRQNPQVERQENRQSQTRKPVQPDFPKSPFAAIVIRVPSGADWWA